MKNNSQFFVGHICGLQNEFYKNWILEKKVNFPHY